MFWAEVRQEEEIAAGLERARTHLHTHTDRQTDRHTDITSPPTADPNFLTHFTAKDGPSIFEWSTLRM